MILKNKQYIPWYYSVRDDRSHNSISYTFGLESDKSYTHRWGRSLEINILVMHEIGFNIYKSSELIESEDKLELFMGLSDDPFELCINIEEVLSGHPFEDEERERRLNEIITKITKHKGLNSLSFTMDFNAFKRLCSYADSYFPGPKIPEKDLYALLKGEYVC